MLRASIDIGSNSILLLIANVVGENLEIVFRDQAVTSLGRDLDKTKKFHEQSMSDSFLALNEYAQKIKQHNLDPNITIVTATEASRVATNSPEFFSKVKNEIGFEITTITGEAEAYYSALGACLDIKNKQDVLIMDIGGASTEIVKVNLKPFELVSFVSLPIGSVRLTNWREEGIIESELKKIELNFKDKISSFNSKNLVCVAGTMTSIANMQQNLKVFEEEKVHNYEISRYDLLKLVDKHENYSVEQFLDQYPFLQKRAKTIWGGMHVAKYVTNLIGTENMTVSTFGLMFGTLLKGKIKDEFIYR